MKMLQAVYLILLPTMVLLAATAGASDRELGQQLARQCSACHGKNGIAVDPESSNLAGQSALYLEKSLKDYKTGARQDRRMSLIVQGLSDDDIKALAAWYSSFTIEVTPPE